jgi:ribonuclease BN (tRNA processing enzyme)
MRLTVLGSAGGYPVPGVAASGYLVDHGETRIWCDIGPGTLMGFPERLDTIDAVVISHEHPDHCLDLLALFHALAYPIQPRAGIPVYATAETIAKMIAFVSPDQTSLIERTFRFVPVAGGSVAEVGPVRIGFSETSHPVHTVAMRFEVDGRSLAYTGDTGPAGNWHRLVEGVDLFLCEATFVGTREQYPYPYHLNAGEAGQIANAAGVDRLVLTHVPVHFDRTRSRAEAEAGFGSEVLLAAPGAAFDLPR